MFDIEVGNASELNSSVCLLMFFLLGVFFSHCRSSSSRGLAGKERADDVVMVFNGME